MSKLYQVLWLCMASIACANPSFDCRKSTTAVEKQICKNTRLSELDVFLNELYLHTMAVSSESAALKKVQISWMRNRPSNHKKLLKSYEQRIGELLLNKELLQNLLSHKKIAMQYQTKCRKLFKDEVMGITFSQSLETLPSLTPVKLDQYVVKNLTYSSVLKPSDYRHHLEKSLDAKTFSYVQQALADANISIETVESIIKVSPESLLISIAFPNLAKGFYQITLSKSPETKANTSQDKISAAYEIQHIYLDQYQNLWVLASGSTIHKGRMQYTISLFAANNPLKQIITISAWLQTYG